MALFLIIFKNPVDSLCSFHQFSANKCYVGGNTEALDIQDRKLQQQNHNMSRESFSLDSCFSKPKSFGVEFSSQKGKIKIKKVPVILI